jgi:hypothetical protein
MLPEATSRSMISLLSMHPEMFTPNCVEISRSAGTRFDRSSSRRYRILRLCMRFLRSLS